MGLEYTIFCDRCGTILNASKESAAISRTELRLWGIGDRVGREDLCKACNGRASDGNPEGGDSATGSVAKP